MVYPSTRAFIGELVFRPSPQTVGKECCFWLSRRLLGAMKTSSLKNACVAGWGWSAQIPSLSPAYTISDSRYLTWSSKMIQLSLDSPYKLVRLIAFCKVGHVCSWICNFLGDWSSFLPVHDCFAN